MTLLRAAQPPIRNRPNVTMAKPKFGSIQKKPSMMVSTFWMARSAKFPIAFALPDQVSGDGYKVGPVNQEEKRGRKRSVPGAFGRILGTIRSGSCHRRCG